MNEYERNVLATFPETEYGKVFFTFIEHEIGRKQSSYDLTAKICNDPIRDDFRVKMGELLNLKWVLDIPRKAREGELK